MKSQRKNITQPADWWDAFKKQAEAEGMTLSEWMGWACRAKLPRGIGILSGLSERPAAHRPKKPKDEKIANGNVDNHRCDHARDANR